MKSGIYIISNKINGSQYIGLSNNIKRRWREHKSPKSLDKTTVLARAFLKYGIVNFKFDVLEYCDLSKLPEREIYWIAKLKPRYNMNEGGAGNTGRKFPKETIEKLRAAGRRQWRNMTDEEKERLVSVNLKTKKGHHVSVETKEKLRTANTGKKQSIRTIKMRSEKMKTAMVGNQNGNKKILKIKDRKVVEVFGSIKCAAASIGVHPSCITGVLKGRRKSSGGYQWDYHTLKLDEVLDGFEQND